MVQMEPKCDFILVFNSNQMDQNVGKIWEGIQKVIICRWSLEQFGLHG